MAKTKKARTLETLAPIQVSALVVLMAEARELSNTEMAELVGFSLTGADRTELVDLKLIESRKVGRSFAHQLSDDGWRTCKNLSDVGGPITKSTLGRALNVLLVNLERSLERINMSHADFFTDGQITARTSMDHDRIEQFSAEVLESRIRSTYADLAKEPGGWVGLADLRPALGAVDRADVDAALHALSRVPGVRLHPVANFKSLTSADREAALRIGDEDLHALAIEAK